MQTNGIILNKGNLVADVKLPDPPDTTAGQAQKTDLWTNGETFQLGAMPATE